MPLSAYAIGRAPVATALILGFGVVRPDAVMRGMRGLAAAIEAT